MVERWLVVSLILVILFGLFVLLGSGNEGEDNVEILLEDWDVQDQLEELEEEDEQDAQDLMDLLFLEDEEDELK